MPTYVYECSSCNETFEVEQRITEDALTDCRCGSKGTVKRIIQPVGIAFKGGGFYVTDASTSSSPKTSTSDSSPSSTADTTGETKASASDAPASSTSAETKPATTGD